MNKAIPCFLLQTFVIGTFGFAQHTICSAQDQEERVPSKETCLRRLPYPLLPITRRST